MSVVSRSGRCGARGRRERVREARPAVSAVRVWTWIFAVARVVSISRGMKNYDGCTSGPEHELGVRWCRAKHVIGTHAVRE